MAQNYVIGVALGAELTNAICLKKDKGPAALIGKWTFPGGKIDPNEEPASVTPGDPTPKEYFDVMTREFQEETSVYIDPNNWVSFGSQSFDDGSKLYLFGVIATQEELNNAKTMETEEVKVLGVGPDKDNTLQYAPDFDQLVSIVANYFGNF